MTKFLAKSKNIQKLAKSKKAIEGIINRASKIGFFTFKARVAFN